MIGFPHGVVTLYVTRAKYVTDVKSLGRFWSSTVQLVTVNDEGWKVPFLVTSPDRGKHIISIPESSAEFA